MNSRVFVENHAQALFRPLQPITSIGRIIDPEPLVHTGRGWTKWAGLLVSILILAAVAYQLRQFDVQHLATLLPSGAFFWSIFVVYYFAGPVSEWIIFRRIWALPIGGFPALLRKLVSNEILLGYLGEVYFYAWARRHADISTAPFGAIKDVTILSALAGNLFTLLMMALSAPLFGMLHLGMDKSAFIGSTMFVLLVSVGMLFLRKRLFTLPRRELWFVALMHSGRIIVTTLLAAMVWHLLLPAVPLRWWLLLSTLRQLLWRLPFLPNKDVVFAGLAAFLVGSELQIPSAITLFSTLILGAHLLVGAFAGLSELARKGR